MSDPAAARSATAAHWRSNPQLRFVARAAILLLAATSLWYWVLLRPLITGLRLSTDLMVRLLPGSGSASITVDPNGDWEVPIPITALSEKFRESVSSYVPKDDRAGRELRSVKVAVLSAALSLFTLGLPLYWAVILAAPRGERRWRALLTGTGLVLAVALVSCVIHVADVAAPYLWSLSPSAKQAIDALEYLGTHIAPTVVPLAIAPMLYPSLRRTIFPWETESAPADPARIGGKAPARGRQRGK